MKTKIKTTNGFTLIEITLYMLIATIILFVAMNFFMNVSQTNSKSINMQEINSNIDFISGKIFATIRSADSVDDANSVFEDDAGILSLNMSDPAKTPTKIYMTDGEIYFKEGASEDIKISSDFIKCTRLNLSKISQSKTPDMITIDMSCEPVNTESIPGNMDLGIHTSILLRK